MRRWPARLLDGFTLASCLFYPLVLALEGEPFFLHWTRAHTVELGVSYLIAALVLALLARAAQAVVSPRGRVLAIVGVALAPAASLGFAVLRGLPLKDTIAPYAAVPAVRWGVIVAVAIACAMLAARPDMTLRLIRAGRLVAAPLTAVAVVAVLRAPSMDAHAGLPSATTAQGALASRPHILVLVFDEMSRSRVYDGRNISPTLPHLAAFGAQARQYHAATAPAGETLQAMPGFLTGRRLADVDTRGNALLEVRADGTRVPLDLDPPDGLFALARSAGLRRELFGYYFPYCALVRSVDACAAYSFYNAATVAAGVSPLNALRTTLILWPHQFPGGLLKTPAFADHQRRLAERLEAHAASPFGATPTLRLVHFSVPHLPFVFTRDGYAPTGDPFGDREDTYMAQLAYVDAIVGRVIGVHERTPVIVVITSDHEWRAVTPRDEWPRIPLLVRMPGQQQREDVTTDVRVEDILRDLVTGGRAP
ncbi:MAG: sulfatase-like hydrolase/transferase [Acidobacteriota bacterium]